MANTGRKIYSNLQQIYVDTGLPTGEADKSNDPIDVDYVQPVYDLIACPPPIPPDIELNKLAIQVVNETNQVIVLSDILIKPQAIIDLSLAYYQAISYSIFPYTTDTDFLIHNQLDSVTKVGLKVNVLSFDIPVTLSIKYKKHSEGSFSTMYSTIVGENDIIDISVATNIETGTNTNILQIVFT